MNKFKRYSCVLSLFFLAFAGCTRERFSAIPIIEVLKSSAPAPSSVPAPGGTEAQAEPPAPIVDPVVPPVLPTVSITSPVANSYTGNSMVLAGACSENGRAVVISGAVSGNATCVSGAFSLSLNLASLAQGSFTLNAEHSNVAGLQAIPSNRSFIKDTLIPTVSITSPAANSYTGNSMTLMGACSESGRVVVISGAASANATCVNGTFSANLNLTSVAEGSFTLNANHSDAAGNAAVPSNRSFIKDTVLPTVSITSPAINSYTGNAMVLAGTCSENNGAVMISGAVSSNATCVNGTFSANLNLASVPDGIFTLNANHSDAAGNAAVTASRNFIKDTSVPTVSITSPAANSYTGNSMILMGTCSESGRVVIISGAVSANVTCVSGAFSITLNLSSLAEGVFTLNANHSDAAGNAAAQASRSFIKDTVIPTVAITSPSASSYANAMNAANFVVSGTCSENGRIVALQAGSVMANPVCAGNTFSAPLNVSSLSEGSFTVTANHLDSALNAAVPSSRNFIKDTMAPVVQITSPATTTYINAANQMNFSVSGTCETGLNVFFGGSVGGSVSCVGGAFTSVFDLSSVPDGLVTISVTQTDLAGNVSSPSGRTYTKKANLPSVTFNTPPNMYVNLQNYQNYAVSGTCSEVGRDVNITGAAIATVVCQAGNIWSTVLNFQLANDGAISLFARTTDVALNQSPIAQLNLILDRVIPTVTLASANSAINPGNQSNFIFNGTCSENGQQVILKVGVTQIGQVVCAGNSYTVATNLSTFPDGTVVVTARHSDAAGNAAVPATLSLPKNSVVPGNFTITGPMSSSNAYPTITWTAASQSYFYDVWLTQQSDCTAPRVQEFLNIQGNITSKTVTSFLVSGTYYVCARSTNIVGNSTDATNSGIFNFTVSPSVLCDRGTWDTICVIETVKSVPDRAVLSGSGKLEVWSGGDLRVVTNGSAVIAMGGDILVKTGGKISANYSLIRSRAMTIEVGGLVSADGSGYPTDSGPGKGGLSLTQFGGGAGYGGVGNASYNSTGGVPYSQDTLSNPTVSCPDTAPLCKGSGGGGAYYFAGSFFSAGGAGGGYMKLDILTTLTINGTLSANGLSGTTNGNSWGGGGSGGSLWVNAASLAGNGNIFAKGGGGATQAINFLSAGSGSGGKVAIYSSTPFKGNVSVDGGSNFWQSVGGVGTFYQSNPSNLSICDSGDLSPNSTCTISTRTAISYAQAFTGLSANIVITGTGELYTPGTYAAPVLETTGNITIQQNGKMTIGFSSLKAANLTVFGTLSIPVVDQGYKEISSLIVENLLSVRSTGRVLGNYAILRADAVTIDAGGMLSADGFGYGSDTGPGRGAYSTNPNGGGGAGHGGIGGSTPTGAGGVSYNVDGLIWCPPSAPICKGSGGGASSFTGAYFHPGSYGGGYIKLDIANALTINGTLSSNGLNGTTNGTSHGGGGAGGSLWVSAGTVAGNGSILAKGGAGSLSGAGGGGKIAVYYDSWSFLTPPGSLPIPAPGGSGAQPGKLFVHSPTIKKQYAFVSSQIYSGDLGGLSGANALCAQLALNSGNSNLNSPSLAWKAILSSSTVDAKTNLVLVAPVYDANNVLVANDVYGFWSGNLLSPISSTETGSYAGNSSVWTNTKPDGTKVSATGTCGDFASTSGSSTTGLSSVPNSQWAMDLTMGCGNGARIYCISQ